MDHPRLILASASPRRSELLQQICVAHSCDPADIDETVKAGEEAAQYVERMAQEKARIVSQRYDSQMYVVLGADTSVVIDDDVLGKPASYEEALSMLMRMSGREHKVLTAVCILWQGREVLELVETQVVFLPLGRADIELYLASNEPWDKAGAYAIQGMAAAFVDSIRGSYSNVVGLPLAQTWRLLKQAGVVALKDSTAREA